MNRIAVIALVFSVAVNVAVAATIGYYWINKPTIEYIENGKEFPADRKAGDRRHFGRDREGRNWKKQLDLSPEQKKALRRIMQENRALTKDLREQQQKKRHEILCEVAREHPDRARLDMLAHEIGEIRVKMEEVTINRLMQIKGLLTPLQQPLFFNLFQEKMKGKFGFIQCDRH